MLLVSFRCQVNELVKEAKAVLKHQFGHANERKQPIDSQNHPIM